MDIPCLPTGRHVTIKNKLLTHEIAMKKIMIFGISLFLVLPLIVSSQELKPAASRTNRINSGFYLKIGPVFPIGKFSTGQVVTDYAKTPPQIPYYAARMGAGMDLGFLIYLGPSFANKLLRAGIDATFLNFWFNPGKPDVLSQIASTITGIISFPKNSVP